MISNFQTSLKIEWDHTLNSRDKKRMIDMAQYYNIKRLY